MNAYLNNLSMCSKSTKPSSTLTKCADEVPQSQEKLTMKSSEYFTPQLGEDLNRKSPGRSA